MTQQYQERIVTKPDKGKPLKRAGRKAADLNPVQRDMVAGPPGEYSTSRTAYRFGRKKVQEVQTVKARNLAPDFLKQPLVRTCILILMVLMAAFALPSSPVNAAQATLSWQAPTTYTDGTPLTSLSGYKVHVGTASRNYSQTIDVGNTTNYTLNNLDDASTYFFATTAYDASGDTSGFSNEVSYATPAPPPSSDLYTLAASAGSGGSISPSGTAVVSQGTNQSFTITPNTGYYVESVVVDGATVASNIPEGGYAYSFNNVTANHTISATFAVRYFHIVATAGTGGSISPADAWILYNTSQTIAITPNSGYKVAGVTVDGVSVGAVSSYTFSNVASNHTINATFEASTANSYTITASAGANGSISPTGTVSVATGTNKSFTITPNSNYYTTSVTVDGAVVASNVGSYTYTFSSVSANHTISASFALCSYKISASAGTGGSISPTSPSVTYGASQTFTITPNSGYKIAGVTVDGVSVGAVSSYTFSNVTTTHTISATFAQNAVSSYTIKASAGSYGSISPSGTVSVAAGTNKSFTITPNSNYYIVSVTVDGAVVATNLGKYTYTFNNVSANHTISATFARCTYKITTSAGTGGSISPISPYVTYGSSKTFTITPKTGYKIAYVKVDGISVGAVSSYTFRNVTSTHTIAATFK